MKNKILFFIAICLILCSCAKTSKRYDSGKDTVVSFGDGTFQLCRGENLSLAFLPTGEGVLMHIRLYQEIDEKVYLVALKEEVSSEGVKQGDLLFQAYAIIDLQNNSIEIFSYDGSRYNEVVHISDRAQQTGLITFLKNYNAFSETDRMFFEGMG